MKNKRVLYADKIRIFAIFLVIVNHVSNAALFSKSPSDFDWWAANIYNSLCRSSVPLFLMISGMLLLGNPHDFSIKQFLRKRFQRVLIPTIIWVTIYYLGHAYQGKLVFSFYQWTKTLLEGGSSAHLWFLYMILGIYLAVPVLIPIVQSGRQQVYLKYYLLFWGLFILLKPDIITHLGINIHLDTTLFATYLGYFILGHYLHSFVVIKRYNFFYCFGILALLISFSYSGFGVYHSFTADNSNNYWFYYRYESIPTCMISIFIFLLFKEKINSQYENKKRDMVINVSESVFGAYLMHAIILYGVFQIYSGSRFYHFIGNQFVAIPVLAVMTFCISMFITLIMKKIPVIRYSVP